MQTPHKNDVGLKYKDDIIKTDGAVNRDEEINGESC